MQSVAVVLIEEPPFVELRGDTFYVTHKHGAVFAYRANVFFAAVAAAASIGRKFKFDGGAEIIQFTRKSGEIAG